MQFTVPERLLVLGFSQEVESDVTTLKEVRAFQDAIGFTDEENQLLKFKQEGAGVRWVEGVVPPKEVEVSETVKGAIRGVLTRLDMEKRLRPAHLSLYERFQETE